MAKNRLKKVPKRPSAKMAAERLRKALSKQKKAELVEVIMGFATSNRTMRQLEARFNVEPPPEEILASTRQAIADATDFDEREINHNFDYDYQAYSDVKRNFSRLIKLGHLREAMELSLELMSQGSYQVEMSDEGMMTEDVEECLRVVIKALGKSDLPAEDTVAWCTKMATKDRVGFICNEEIQSLKNRLDASHSQ